MPLRPRRLCIVWTLFLSVLATSVAAQDSESAPRDWQDGINEVFGSVNSAIGKVFFYPIPIPYTGREIPLRAGGTVGDTAEEALAAGSPAPVLDDYTLEGEERLLTVPGADFALRAVRAGDTIESPPGTPILVVARHASASTPEELVVEAEAPGLSAGPLESGAVLKLKKKTMPLTVLWLITGAVIFTLRMRFINVRGFRHAVAVVRGKYDSPEDTGEVSSFQALTTALSATVGLGNIAGVTIAVTTGGPGAIFWMILAGVLGMSSKFTECSLGQMYRETRPDGRLMGGAMFYLSKGLREMGLGSLGRVLAVFFSILCIGGSLAGGNAFQVSQSMRAVQRTVPFFVDFNWVYGLVLTFAVGVVIIGGLRRIAAAAEKIVPTMCGIYILAALWIIFSHASHVPGAFALIVGEAFSLESIYGGFIGVLVLGFQRAAFSNEAGIGSAAIAHSAAKVPHPIREGIVALLEPFIDTVVVCTMTGLVIVITGAYDSGDPRYTALIAEQNGAGVTSEAFRSVIEWFPYVLSVAVILFAYSTMISWSYYGERCWAYLFGDKSSMVYRIIFLIFVFLGSVVSATNALEFGDLMILGMALPNILGVLILSGKVKRNLDDYLERLRSGVYKAYK